MFFTTMPFFCCNALKYVSMNNQKCKVRPVIININRNETLFYPYSIFVYKCSVTCNDVNNFYVKLYVSDVVKTWISKYLIKLQ